MSTIAFLNAHVPVPAADSQETMRTPATARDGIFTEMVGFEELRRLNGSLTELAARAIEPNAFLEPAFVVPLVQHYHSKKNAKFLLAWAQNEPDAARRLIGFLPADLPKSFLSVFARSPLYSLAPLGIPLFDQERGAEAFHQMMEWLHEHHRHIKGFLFPLIPKDGPIFAMLQHYAETAQNKLTIVNQHQRAVLTKAVTTDAFPNGFISTKRRNNYRQQRRRLNRSGEVSYTTLSTPAEIRKATESFLSLEYKGWKGARGTALLAATNETTFFRSMMRLMALEGKCRVHSLNLGDTPIAMGVVLKSGARDYYWKTTYDESYAQFSPGVQITLELTQTQLADPSVLLTDSCAIPNHPMIDHLWRERVTMANVIVPIHKSRSAIFTLRLWQEIAYHSLRTAAKSGAKRLLRRRR